MATLRLIPESGTPLDVILDKDKDETVIGRDPACDHVLSDGSVSRRHARIEKRASGLFVVDQNSANGTFIDSQRTAEAELKHGQELRFGAMNFRVEFAGEAAQKDDAGGPDDIDETIAAPMESLPTSKPPPVPEAAGPIAPSPSPPVPPPPPPPRAGVSPPPPPRPAPPARPSSPSRPAPRAGAGRSMGSPVPAMKAGPAPKKGKGPWFWVSTGCCGCLLLAGLTVGGIALFVYYATEKPVEAATAFVEDLRKDNYDGAYGRLSSGYQSRLPKIVFRATVVLHPGLRENREVRTGSRSVNNDRATLEVELVAESGQIESVTFHLVQQDGVWKIDDMQFASEGPFTRLVPIPHSETKYPDPQRWWPSNADTSRLAIRWEEAA